MKKRRKVRMSMLSMFLVIAMFAAYAAGSTGTALTAYAEAVQPEAVAELESESTAEEGISLRFNQEYATVGSPLTVALSGLPEGAECKYQWKVGNSVKSTQDSYTPVQADLEKMLVVTATVSGSHTGTYQASMYLSKLPVLYVDTKNGQAITSKEDYIDGNFRIQGNEEYNASNTTLYDGAIEIRGRGNSTWANPKKPYKILTQMIRTSQ